MDTLLCKDCKHSFKPWTDFIHGDWALRCRISYKEETTTINLVTGPVTEPAHYLRCSTARLDYLSDPLKDSNCGKAAKFWQPKHKSGLFKLIAKEHN